MSKSGFKRKTLNLRRKEMSKIKFAAISVIITLLLFGMVNIATAAVPVLPSSFYGAVTFSDSPPAVDDVMQAFVPGISGAIASAKIKESSGDLVYSINLPGDDLDTAPKDGGEEGDIVTFKISERIVAKGVWHSGTNVLLNIHPPKAVPGGEYSGTVGSAVAFNGSAVDSGGGTITYEWDLDNNGSYETTGHDPSFTWLALYSSPVNLKVTDTQGGEGSASTSVTIGQGTAGVTLGNLAQTYNGSAKSISVTTDPVGLTVTVTYDGSATAPSTAGSYAVVATVSDTNYIGSANGTLVISPADATVTLGNLTQTYDGSAKSVSVTTNPVGLTVTVTYDGSGTAPSAAGSYPVIASITNPNYSGSANGTLIISPAPATVTLTGLSHVYDSSAKSAIVTTNPVGLSHSITYNGSSTAPTNANSYPVVVTITDPNYTGTEGDTLVIAKASSTTSVTGGGTFVYNDSAHPAAVSVTGAGGLSLTPAPVYSGSCLAAPVNVADTPCTASYTFAGDTNHDGSSGTTSITITKAPATAVLTGLSHVFDSSAKSAIVTTNPVGLSHSITYNGSSTAPTNANSYPVVVTITDPNYTGTGSGTLVIAKASSTTTVTGGGTFVYSGSAHPAVVTVTGAGGLSQTPAPDYSGSCLAAPVNVADTPCTASYIFAGDTNHEGSSGTTSITITKAPATAVLTGLSHVYDGSAKSATVTTTPVDLSHSITYNGSSTAPALPGSYAVVATITDPNYSGSASGTMVILAKHSISLVPGWNLVSFNVHPTSTAIADVLAPIAGSFDLVYAWDADASSDYWLKYDNVPSSPDTLSILDEKMGFWIHMTAADTLDVTGTLPTTSSIAINITSGGWNLVGYPSEDNGTLPAILSANGVGTDFSLVYAYMASDTADPWKLYDRLGLPYANDLAQLLPGWGYWIKASADHTWGVAY
jgi:hypothetical protein